MIADTHPLSLFFSVLSFFFHVECRHNGWSSTHSFVPWRSGPSLENYEGLDLDRRGVCHQPWTISWLFYEGGKLLFCLIHCYFGSLLLMVKTHPKWYGHSVGFNLSLFQLQSFTCETVFRRDKENMSWYHIHIKYIKYISTNNATRCIHFKTIATPLWWISKGVQI